MNFEKLNKILRILANSPPTISKKYSRLLLIFSLALSIVECAPKKAKALGGSSSGSGSSGATSPSSAADIAVSYTQSTITVSASSLNHGDTVTVYATFKNSAGTILDMPNETMSFSLTGGGTSSGTFSTPQYDSTNKRWYSTFTGTTAGTAKEIVVTHQVNGSPQALTSTLPSVTVNTLTAPTVTISMNTSRNGSNPFDVYITFSRAVTGFNGLSGGVSASNTGGLSISDPSSYNGSETVYRVTVTPNDSSDVTLNVAANLAQDALGYYNDAAAQFVARAISMGFTSISNNAHLSSTSVNGYCTSSAGLLYWSVAGSNSDTSCTSDNWSVNNFPFTNGLNTLTINQFDNDNNNISTSIDLYYDTTAPTISLSSVSGAYGDNINDAQKSAVTITGSCNDDLSPNASSISVTVTDYQGVNYGPYSTTCNNAASPNFTVVADLSSMTVAGQISATATITDSAGNTGSDSRAIGTYRPSGSISNLTENNGYTCIGNYCPWSPSSVTYTGSCANLGSNSPNDKLHVSLLDASSNLITTFNTSLDCSGGSFNTGAIYTYSDPFNGRSDGAYKIKVEACSDYGECSSQTLDITLNNTNDCWSTGSSTSYSNGDPGNLGDNSCTTGTPISTTACDDGSTGSAASGTSSDYCNCQGYTNTYYTSYNNNGNPSSACSKVEYSETYNSSQNCMGGWDPYDSTWNSSINCSCQSMSNGSSNNNIQMSCGETVYVQNDATTYTCGSDSSILNGCWRCTDNSSSDPTTCTNNTYSQSSGRTWYYDACSDAVSMTQGACESNYYSSGRSWYQGCVDVTYDNDESACTGNGSSWQMVCSDRAYNSQESCERIYYIWTPAHCNSGGYVDQNSCEYDIFNYEWLKNGW